MAEQKVPLVGEEFLTNIDESLTRVKILEVVQDNGDDTFNVMGEDGVDYSIAWSDFEKEWQDQDVDLSIEDLEGDGESEEE